jgi:hypothetical protein
MDIFDADMWGLGCHLITGKDEDKTSDDESDDSSSHVDHADDQKLNSTFNILQNLPFQKKMSKQLRVI